jgi:Rrf2 family protein
MVLLAKRHNPSAGGKEILSTRIISQKEGIPFDFLEKIISQLEKAKLVKGKKGTGGGYVLAKMPNKITARDIVSALEGTTSVDCSLCGMSKKCISKSVWKKIDDAISKTLKNIKLSELIK